jgi:hypothetical protein
MFRNQLVFVSTSVSTVSAIQDAGYQADVDLGGGKDGHPYTMCATNFVPTRRRYKNKKKVTKLPQLENFTQSYMANLLI